MSKETEKWLGAALGFGAGIVWVAAGAGAALVCLLGAGLCAGVVIAREAGLVGWVGATATGVRKRVEARIPAERPPRTIGRRQTASRAKAAQAEPKAAQAKAAPAKSTAQPKPTVQPKRRPETPVETPLPAAKPKKPYDHDEPSSEHVYEVATYGW